MNNLFEIENKYLNAKLAYYKGTPQMSDTEFDTLENYLKEQKSKVVNQVGYKIKDFDFSHPTKMLSLSKIQTETSADNTTNYMVDAFMSWYNKRVVKVGHQKLKTSPKFDGNAINIIYVGNKLSSVLTRGDGSAGKNVTEAFRSKLPDTLKSYTDLSEDVVQIRAEVVIDKYLFAEKYGTEFANPRNYVAGVINSADDLEKISELTILPIHFIINGNQVDPELFMCNDFVSENWYETERGAIAYLDIVKEHEKQRDTFKYQLDGVVFAFPASVRKELGENSHDPEWSVAIKFVPDEATTTVNDIEWNVGKSGELSPVLLLEPVQLSGSVVRRASGYNYGYILSQGLGIGAVISIAKAGDIIPECQSIIVPSDNFTGIPKVCPSCGAELEIDGIHLMCPNEWCTGKIGKQLSRNAKFIDLKGLGPKTFDAFSTDFADMVDLLCWVKTNGNSTEIEKYGIPYGSRTHELFLQSFNTIKSLTYGQVIVIMSYDNVGLKLADQVANYYAGIESDFSGHDRSIVEMFKQADTQKAIQQKVDQLNACGISVDIPIKKQINMEAIYVCMTGSPKNYGFETKSEFASKFNGQLVEVSISSKECQYLITDDYNSTSSKMKTAEKKGIPVLDYGDFYNDFNNNA